MCRIVRYNQSEKMIDNPILLEEYGSNANPNLRSTINFRRSRRFDRISYNTDYCRYTGDCSRFVSCAAPDLRRCMISPLRGFGFVASRFPARGKLQTGSSGDFFSGQAHTKRTLMPIVKKISDETMFIATENFGFCITPADRRAEKNATTGKITTV